MTRHGQPNIGTVPERALDVLAHALTELRDILLEEREALADVRADIEAIGERKRIAVQAVEAAEQTRREHGIAAAGARWSDVQALAEACRHQNLTNGALLALRKRHTARLLAQFSGQNDITTYEASGHVAGLDARGRAHISA